MNLTARLNIQTTCIALLLMLGVIAYSQWITLREDKMGYGDQLKVVTAFLVKTVQADSFAAIVAKQRVADKTAQDQVLAINQELQPYLANILMPNRIIKFGIYSKTHDRIVANGPDFDISLLAGTDHSFFAAMKAADAPRLGEAKNSFIGSSILYHIRPIVYNGTVIGQAFACVNLDQIYALAWHRAINTFFGGFIALLFIIIFLQDVFIRLKKDMELFAETIVRGEAKSFESNLPELTPILQYISEQTEKMAQLDRLNTIGEMAASLGHEVRNPMTTVRGFLQHLGNKTELKDFRVFLDLMIDELDRANAIITEFLSLAKNQVMNFEEINLNLLIKEIFPLLQADALRNNCQIELSLAEIPAMCLDEKSIRQLILNMVRNAIEAMPRGGIIQIITSGRDRKVLLAIKDQGIGIPAQLLDKLGTPFFTTKERGTGLGLAICYRIVQRHDAAIAVESKPGEGTVFTVSFNQA